MAAVETAAPRAHGKGKKRKPKRVGVRIDMTPMVDVAFLLLTFFMLTTTMSRPQTMEINLPPSDTPVEVAQSNLMTIRVIEDGKIFWSIGTDKPAKVEYKDFPKLLIERNQLNQKLITLIKIDRKVKYHWIVDIMDELNLANVTRFSLAPMLESDKRELEKLL